MNSERYSTSDDRNWQSPLKSPHTLATQGSHASRALRGCRACASSDTETAAESGAAEPLSRQRESASPRRGPTRLTYPVPATTGAYWISLFTPPDVSTSMLTISPCTSCTPPPTTLSETVPSVICRATVDAVLEALSTTSLLGLSSCVTMPGKALASTNDAPLPESSASTGRSPSFT